MSGVTVRRSRWSDAAIARLNDRLHCPWCEQTLAGPRCTRCGADYSIDGIGAQLWDASQAAVAALEARQAVLDRVSIGPASVPAPAPSPAVPPAKIVSAPPRSSATVQSVLAVAGAGLVAVAAIVFTFFNPDLTDALVRGLLVGGVTLVFLVGARVLVRRGLQFSAEAVGALGLVFLGLDIQALTAIAPDHPWTVAALSTLAVGAAMVWVAQRLRIRVWLWGSLVGLAFVPAMAGFAVDSRVLGFAGTAAASFALLAATPALARRFGAALRAERGTLTAIQLIAVFASLAAGTLFGELPVSAVTASLSALLAAFSGLAFFSTRHPLPRLWSFLAGCLGTAAAVALPFALWPGIDGGWWIAVIAAAAVVGANVVAVASPVPRTTARVFVSAGALTVVAVTALAPVVTALLSGLMTVTRGDELSEWSSGVSGQVVTTVALAVLAVGLLAFARLDARLHPPAAQIVPDRTDTSIPAPPAPIGTRWVGDLALWFAGLAALTVLSIPSITLPGRVAIGLGFAAAAAGGLALVASRRPVRPAVRVPIVAGAHLLVLLAIVLSWRETGLAVVVGAVVVVVIAVVAAAMPASIRFLHVGVGYAYALFVFATALSLQGVGDIAALCLTTCAGAVTAIVATYLPFVRRRAWYAVLAVTAVPFLLGVAQVLVERSGWTALSTSLIFGLALTLVVARRPGLGTPLRVMSAALLVPSLAVVVVCLGAQLLAGSGSPVVLPIIALIVALVLPVTGVVQAGLSRRIGARDAALARIAIEGSTLLTAVIAVALALLREAAGLTTTLVVLLVLGAGGIATAWWAGRRYGWAIAGASFTGALWCVWGLTGVATVEPYLLPPALGVAVVGAILTARGVRSLPLYAAGLSIAVIPLVVLTAVTGPPLRGYALVAAAWALVALAALFGGPSRLARRMRVLRPATLAVAVVAAAAGAVLGVRFGLGLAPVPEGVPTIVAALGIAAIGAMAAAIAGGCCVGRQPRDPGSRRHAGCSRRRSSTSSSRRGRPSSATGSRSGRCGRSCCCSWSPSC
ncbi:hypothetical protein [Microbacterium sp.]|uniref:hypothetical protein n=1 Tax=Microbacterium sp. TaxID=51671 RepID=UPI003F70E2E8